MKVPLRFTVAALCALSILVVAIVTLTVTYQLSLGAIRDLASSHAEALVQVAGGKTSELFERMNRNCKGVTGALSHLATDLKNPQVANRSTWWVETMNIVEQSQISENFGQLFTVGFVDESSVRCGRSFLAGGVPTCWAHFARNRTFEPLVVDHVRQRDDVTLKEVIPPLPILANEFSLTMFFDVTRAIVKKFDDDHPGEVEWGPLFMWDAPFGLFLLAAARMILRDSAGKYIGLVANNIDVVSTLKNYLVSVKGTENTVIFSYDDNALLASTNEASITTHVNFPPEYNMSTIDYSVCSPRNGAVDAYQFRCRLRPNEVDYAPLSAVSNDAEFLFSRTSQQRIIDVDGSRYHVAVEPVLKSVNDTFTVRLILFLPENDLIGKIITGRDVSISITAALIVFCGIVTSLVTFTLLQPISKLAHRMYVTGSLRDDDDPSVITSSTLEISDLLVAYEIMRDQLYRIRSFVPQSLLIGRGTFVQDGFGDDVSDTQSIAESAVTSVAPSVVEDDDGHPFDPATPDMLSAHPSSDISGDNSSKARKVTFFQMLETGISVSNRRVSVLSFNLRGFNARIAGMICDEFVRMQEDVVSVIVSEAKFCKGMVDSIHGDRAIISFNAVVPTVSYTRQAAVCALRIRDAIDAMESGFGLPCTMGIAQGVATVGNVGSAQMKRFDICGDVLSRAAGLERLSKRYSNAISIVTTQVEVGDMAQDIETQYIDIVPFRGSKRTLVAAVMGLKVEKPEEWMYQLQQSSTESVYSFVNSAFCALFAKSREAALHALEEREKVLMTSGTTNPADGEGFKRAQKFLKSGTYVAELGEYYATVILNDIDVDVDEG